MAVVVEPSQLHHPDGGQRPKPEPVRRRGEPFFDQLVGTQYSPRSVRRALYQLLDEQYGEAGRIQRLRGWGGAQAHGNDRYLYSLEQERTLAALLPGAELFRPSQSLMYGIGDALIYSHRLGFTASDCPTTAQVEPGRQIQVQLAHGRFYETPTLFDPYPGKPRTVVWLLFTGNHLEGGPLSSYLAVPTGLLPDGRIDWLRIEPLIPDEDENDPDNEPPSSASGPDVPPEPTLSLTLRR